jgi:hypothetical protein
VTPNRVFLVEARVFARSAMAKGRSGKRRTSVK